MPWPYALSHLFPERSLIKSKPTHLHKRFAVYLGGCWPFMVLLVGERLSEQEYLPVGF